MKSLSQIHHDNRMTNRDFGSMCNWAVFHEGDFIAQFVEEADAREFASNYTVRFEAMFTVSKAEK